MLRLDQAIVTESQRLSFGQVNARLVGPDAARILPWMLAGASERANDRLKDGLLPRPRRAPL
ncbi:hypothetical protein [Nonomuraea diastatica]|uniref:Uncharacterized protein n=1 Tax=Nonomuraea diastatica TaxID=1848329 RepID=A0A4R4VH66_9ACTN|nr:hypothetical protein [Nonomuraea diastatica]TDC99109.1 hypothetical protein E1294_52190 [Nonomuraea diastatica]